MGHQLEIEVADIDDKQHDGDDTREVEHFGVCEGFWEVSGSTREDERDDREEEQRVGDLVGD